MRRETLAVSAAACQGAHRPAAAAAAVESENRRSSGPPLCVSSTATAADSSACGRARLDAPTKAGSVGTVVTRPAASARCRAVPSRSASPPSTTATPKAAEAGAEVMNAWTQSWGSTAGGAIASLGQSRVAASGSVTASNSGQSGSRSCSGTPPRRVQNPLATHTVAHVATGLFGPEHT